MLLFFDGFEHYVPNQDLPTGGKWNHPGGNVMQIRNNFSRTGTGSAFTYNANFQNNTKNFVTTGGVVVGVAWYTDAWSYTTSANLFTVREGGINHLAVGLNAAQQLVIFRGATIIATGTTVFPMNSWYYIEFKAIIHDTAGSYEVRVDGVTELSASGIDTRNGGTGPWNNVWLASPSNSNAWFDDFYLLDTSGATLNDFLGPVRVETLFPQTDAVAAGTHAGLTPSTGTDHGAMVDEPAPNTTDYNSSAVVGAKDTYQYPSMTLAGVIHGIQTNLYVAKSDAAIRRVCPVVRVNGVDYDGPDFNPLTTFNWWSEVRAVNPNTGLPWTVADIAALEVGMKVTV